MWMSKIDDVHARLQEKPYFSHLSGKNHVRILDTPHAWGQPFGPGIMPAALARQAEFERAVVEIVHQSRYRCDLASLNSPDPDWARVILAAMDLALSAPMDPADINRPIQFRFLFGQTPLYPASEPPNYTDFKAALLRLVRTRCQNWPRLPDIWLGRFFRLQAGILSSLKTRVFGEGVIDSDDCKMTWNHAKIIAADGAEALVGGHNLNMDLFRSYPPVHDVSVVVHGEAAYGAQLFLNQMWACGADLLSTEYLDVSKLAWQNGDGKQALLTDPLPTVGGYLQLRWQQLLALHEAAHIDDADADEPVAEPPRPAPGQQDQQALVDLAQPAFPPLIGPRPYARLADYTLATRILAVGKYWTGPHRDTDYQHGAELMKEVLIKTARQRIRLSQMDLISAWKKNWSDHVVCHWLMDALLGNPDLVVEVVVSPLDGGAGAEGDQYSFGSGARRTFELIEYYMTHDVLADTELADRDIRAAALRRLFIAPLFYTEVPVAQTREGLTYKWPDLPPEGYTATLKQAPVRDAPPRAGVIGSAVQSVIHASGNYYDKVWSAPGNHAKIMIIDDALYVVGSDNLYPGTLSEFNLLVEGEPAVSEMLESYWQPLWRYSGPHSCHG